MSIINSKEIVNKFKHEQLKAFSDFQARSGRQAKLVIVRVGSDKASEVYVRMKVKYAESLNIDAREVYFEKTDTESLAKVVLMEGLTCDGIIVQLPLPSDIDSTRILNSIKKDKDVDSLSEPGEGGNYSDCSCEDCVFSNQEKFKEFSTYKKFTQPVAFAVREILKNYVGSIKNKKIVILGKGKLVGLPVREMLEDWVISDSRSEDVRESIALIGSLDELDYQQDELDYHKQIKQADILISGIGKPDFIKPQHLKEGVVLVDAGTSESSGQVVGDIDLACEPLASVFSSCRAGVGPLTVCGIFENLKLSVESK